MMSRILPILIAALLPMTTFGRNLCCDPPMPIGEGWTFVDSIAAPCWRMDAHLRMALDRSASSWSLAWEWIDSLNYMIATADIPPGTVDDIYGRAAVVTVASVVDGLRTELGQAQAPCHGSGFSLKVVADAYSARVYAGSEMQTLVASVPQPCGLGRQSAVMAHASRPLLCQRLAAMCDALAQPRQSRFGTVDELMEYLAESDDPAEGLWQHIDREISPQDASLGGKYRLATARGDDGAYDIIYISGAAVNSAGWQPLQAKGRMAPTIFDADFDLEWIDAHGRELADDNSAALSEDGQLLTLRFPVYRSQLRLSRVPVAKKR